MMDISETYIKMCDCGEIQKQWNPTDGDYCWHDDGGTDYLGSWEFPATTTVVHIATGNNKNYWYNWLWLPRQDQLQEMYKGHIKNNTQFNNLLNDSYGNWHIDRLREFHRQCVYEKKWLYQSWEQLWLAFVMKEKYNKTWDGSGWIST